MKRVKAIMIWTKIFILCIIFSSAAWGHTWQGQDLSFTLSDQWTASSHKDFFTASLGICDICLYFDPTPLEANNFQAATAEAKGDMQEALSGFDITIKDSFFDQGSINGVPYKAFKGTALSKGKQLNLEMIILSPGNNEFYSLFYYATDMGLYKYRDEVSIVLNTINASAK